MEATQAAAWLAARVKNSCGETNKTGVESGGG